MERNEFLHRIRVITERCVAEWAGLQAEGQAQKEVESRNDLRWAYTEQVEKLGSEFTMGKFDIEKARHQDTITKLAAPGAVPPITARGVQAAIDSEYMDHRDRIVALLKTHKDFMEMTLRCSRLTRMEKILHLRDNVPMNEQDAHTKGVVTTNSRFDDLIIRRLAAFYKTFHQGNYHLLRLPAYIAQVKEGVVHPIPSKWPGLGLQVAEDSLRVGVPARRREKFQKIADASEAARIQVARQRIPATRAELAALGFEFEKFLGVGGHGLAALFTFHDRHGRMSRIVVKMDLHAPATPAESGIFDEKKHLTTLKGRMHIVQKVSLGDLKANMLVPDPAARALDESDDILVLEFLEQGDVDQLICKLVELKLDLNSQILWEIFKCLFKGCVAMAWPGKNAPPRAGAVVSETSDGLVNDAEEQADFTDPSSRALVHFDIDPRNIFIGQVDSNGIEHDILPVFKIGDFGVAEVVNRDDIVTTWQYRHRGKYETLTPEQFCREWDYIYEAPYYERLRDPANKLYSTAGRFNKYHNLYQIAVVMWCLITKVGVPTPKLEVFHDRDGTVIYTYGNELMGPQYNHIDTDLREALCHCLAHDPDSRPNFGALETLINKKTNPRFWDQKMRDQTEMLRKALFREPATTPSSSQGSVNQQQPRSNLRQMHHNARSQPNPPHTRARPPQVPPWRPQPNPPQAASRRLRRVTGRVTRPGPANGMSPRRNRQPIRVTPPATRAFRAVGRAFGGAGGPVQNQPSTQFYGLNYDGQNVQAPLERTSTVTKVKRRMKMQWDRLINRLKDLY